MNKYEIRYIDEQHIHQSIIWMADSMTEASAEILEMNGVDDILSISLAEKGRENLGYNIVYLDMRGHRREFLSREDDLRKCVEDFYLDECPAYVESIIQVKLS